MELTDDKRAEGKSLVWNRNHIQNLLNNRFYLGEMVYNKVRTVGIGKNKSHFKLPKEEWKIIPDHHEALVTEEEYQKVAKFGKSYLQKEESHPFTGKILCGGCVYHIYRKKSAENYLTDLYGQYSSGEITAAEYTERKAETEKQLAGWKEKESAKWEEYYAYQDEMNRLESDMKSIIRFSHIEKLTKEVVETFIDKVYLYKDKRIEIVWKFQSRGA